MARYPRIKRPWAGGGGPEVWRRIAQARLGLGRPGTADLAALGLAALPATVQELKRAYRVRMLVVHPDRGGSDDQAAQVTVAFARLLAIIADPMPPTSPGPGWTRPTAPPDVRGGLQPMLAYRYEDAKAALRYPCYVQPKLDGHRCLAEPSGLWSKSRRAIRSVPHVAAAVRDLGLAWLDGELYNHELKADFERLTSLLRAAAPAPGHEIVQLHVYDIPGPGTFAERHAAMERLKPRLFGLPIRIVETVLVNNEAEMLAAFHRFVAQGYEGAILRNAAGRYVGGESPDLLKFKQWFDQEFKIVGLREGRGILKGCCGAFVCGLPNGDTFRVKLAVPIKDLQAAWEHPDRWVGKLLTVKYRGLTKRGKPRFGIGVRVREDL